MEEIQKLQDKIESCKKDIQRLLDSDLSNEEIDLGIFHNQMEISEYKSKIEKLLL